MTATTEPRVEDVSMPRARAQDLTPARVTLVIPIYNESAIVGELTRRIQATLATADVQWDAVLVDDGSVDGSFDALCACNREDPRFKVVRLARNFGHQVAISAGLEHAAGDAVVVMDGDLQDPPELLGELLAKWRAGWDVIYAVRRSRQESRIRRFVYWSFYRLLKVFAQIEIPSDSGDFCLMDRRVVDVVVSMRERNRFIRGLRSWTGFAQTALPYDRAARIEGSSKYSSRKLLRLAMDGLVGFSYVPLRVATVLGIGSAAVSFIGIVFVLYLRLFTTRSIPGFASTAIIILFLGGIQLLTLGVVGEYVGRIYDEVRQRPLFVVRDRVGFQ